MKKTFKITAMLLICLVLMLNVFTASAQNDPCFKFELSVDGANEKAVKNGDVITVALRLMRTDSEEGYVMYAMQNEIVYDTEFFELVESGIMTRSGIKTVDVSQSGTERAFYMNYLSFAGGESWEHNTVVGYFQLKVIANNGSSVIKNTDYLVSNKDGTVNYDSTASDVTVKITADTPPMGTSIMILVMLLLVLGSLVALVILLVKRRKA